jgi:hypothetical protein
MSRSLNNSTQEGSPKADDAVGGKQEMIFETDGRFLGLKIRIDLVERLHLSGKPDDPSIKNPQYSFCWLNEWKDMSSYKGSVTYGKAANAKKQLVTRHQDDNGQMGAEHEGMLANVKGQIMDDYTEDESSTNDDESYCYCDSIKSSDDSESENQDTVDHEEQYLGFSSMVDEAKAESCMEEDKNLQTSDSATSSKQGTLEDHMGNSWHRSDSEGMSLCDYEEVKDDAEDDHISNNFFSYPDYQRINMATVQEATKDDDDGTIKDTKNTVSEMHLERDYLFVEPTIKKKSKPRPFLR